MSDNVDWKLIDPIQYDEHNIRGNFNPYLYTPISKRHKYLSYRITHWVIEDFLLECGARTVSDGVLPQIIIYNLRPFAKNAPDLNIAVAGTGTSPQTSPLNPCQRVSTCGL